MMQRSVASANRRRTIRFADLKQKRYWLPLSVLARDFEDSVYLFHVMRRIQELTFTALSHFADWYRITYSAATKWN